ncbi:MAG TPA: alpha/beta hydrolase [Usitatibacter sp.]|nr:alpha/beta hydrolase [Usitatibacter sp.]
MARTRRIETKPLGGGHIRLSDLRGFHRLASDATVGLTDVVEAMHHAIASTSPIFGESPEGRTSGITGTVYGSVRGVARLVGGGVDALLGMLAPLVTDTPSSQEREAVLAALNGVLGDYLAASANPLAIAMALRAPGGVPLAIARDALAAAFPEPERKLLVLAHGLCMNDLEWNRSGHDHGASLSRDLGYAPIYLHYNTGRHISTNGREFADLMETLLREWPHPVERLAIVGHSMGGLVARSACHYATLAGHAWPGRLNDLVFLGTPHLGVPLARAGAWADLVVEISPYTKPFARLARIRSAGIHDLRYADLRDEDWQRRATPGGRVPRSRLPLPRGVRCYAAAASTQARPASRGAKARGDGLVPLDSALGRHRDPSVDLGLPETRRWVGYGMGHFDLLSRAEVYARIRHWLSARTM